MVGQTELFNLSKATSLGVRKLNSNLLNFTKKIYLASYPTCLEGLGKCIHLGIDNNLSDGECYILNFGPSKMPFKVMHRKEVTHSNGS